MRIFRRSEIVHLANGMLRHRFGYTPKDPQSSRAVLLRQGCDARSCLRGRQSWVKARARRPAVQSTSPSTAAQPGKLVDLKKGRVSGPSR